MVGLAVASGMAVAALLLRGAGGTDPARPPSASTEPRSSSRTPVIAGLWIVFFLGAMPALAVFARAAAILEDLGFTARFAGTGVAVLAAGNALGRTAAGWLSDEVDRRSPATSSGRTASRRSTAGSSRGGAQRDCSHHSRPAGS